MNEEKIINGYYQSNIKTSRNEDSVYAMKYASQQMLIDNLQQENALLKDKLKDIEKILDADCCVENIYQAMCQYLNIHDFELDLENYLKEN